MKRAAKMAAIADVAKAVTLRRCRRARGRLQAADTRIEKKAISIHSPTRIGQCRSTAGVSFQVGRVPLLVESVKRYRVQVQ